MTSSCEQKNKKCYMETIAFIILLAISFVIVLIKLPYGIGGNDEAFYLTIPHRLMMGDGLFTDEWHVSQLSSIILYPVFKLFYMINGSTEGILLFFRYVYLVFQTIAACIIFYKLRKYSWGAIVASISFLLFTPHNITALSYHSMGMVFFTLFCLFVATNENNKKSNQFFSGLFLALSVLCNPFLVLVYIIYSAAAVVTYFLKKKIVIGDMLKRFTFKNWFWMSLGVVFCAMIFFVFLFVTTDVNRIFQNLPMIFNDPEHPSRSFFNLVLSYFAALFIQYRLFICVSALVLLVIIVDKNRTKHAGIFFIVMLLNTIYRIIRSTHDLNIVMFPLAFLGLFAYILTKKKNHSIFFMVYFSGIIYSFCLNISSNQSIYAITIGMATVLVASVILIKDFVDEFLVGTGKKYMKAIIKILVLTVMITQILAQGYVKVKITYWEPAISEVNILINNGPLKGLLTSIEKANIYYSILEDLEYYSGKSDGRILYIGPETWSYLYVDLPYGTFSAWSSIETSDVSNRWESYFFINRDNVPKYIYIKKGVAGKEREILEYAVSKGYTLTQTTAGYMLESN